MRRRIVLASFAAGIAIVACSVFTDFDGLSTPDNDASGTPPLQDAGVDGVTPNGDSSSNVGDAEGGPAELCGTKDCLGGACVANACRPAIIAASQAGARGITLFGEHVYWVTANAVRRVSKRGGVVETLAMTTDPQSRLLNLAVDATSVYVTDEGASSVGRVSLEAAGTKGIVSIATGQTKPSGIAVDDKFVWYVTEGGLRRVTKNAGGTTVPDPIAVANHGANVVLANGKVYFLNELGNDTVNSVETQDTTKFVCLFNNQTNPHGLAVDSTRVFHALHRDAPNGRIRSKLITETCQTNAIEPGMNLDSPFEIAIDIDNVYWTVDHANGSVFQLPKAGGLPRELANAQDIPWGIAVDAQSGIVYWTNSGTTGSVMALVR